VPSTPPPPFMNLLASANFSREIQRNAGKHFWHLHVLNHILRSVLLLYITYKSQWTNNMVNCLHTNLSINSSRCHMKKYFKSSSTSLSVLTILIAIFNFWKLSNAFLKSISILLCAFCSDLLLIHVGTCLNCNLALPAYSLHSSP
jgi:hypothetical protein